MSGNLPSVLRCLSKFAGRASGAVDQLKNALQTCKDFDVAEFIRWLEKQEKKKKSVVKFKEKSKKRQSSKLKNKSIRERLVSKSKSDIKKSNKVQKQSVAIAKKSKADIKKGSSFKSYKSESTAKEKLPNLKLFGGEVVKQKESTFGKTRDTILAAHTAKVTQSAEANSSSCAGG